MCEFSNAARRSEVQIGFFGLLLVVQSCELERSNILAEMESRFMKTMGQIIFVVVAFSSVAVAAEPTGTSNPTTALIDYVNRPEPAFAWKLKENQNTEAGTVYRVELTSQEWHGITWKHPLNIYEPPKISYPHHVLLFVTGGRNGQEPSQSNIDSGLKLAHLTGARVAVLHQVPNQPLLGDRREDNLITETWLRFLKTGDKTWPLLFPMVKSAVKAMDAVEAIAKTQWKQPVKGFVITGASKRGWTSWLTPVADKRIIATAPIVIDVLNFRAQMQHQLDTWGKFSEQIIDYSSKGLIVHGRDETPRETELRTMMDPYNYRAQLKLPKLLINGTNDQYWVVDAMRLYWDDLVGPKFVLQVPNAGHSLKGGRESAYTTLAAFFRMNAAGAKLPQIKWQHSHTESEITLKINSSPPAKTAMLWTAHSETKDFRKSKWNPRPLESNDGAYLGRVAKPAKGHLAMYGEVQFEFDGLKYSLSTLIHRDGGVR